MNSHRIRRATTDDLPQLTQLWNVAHLPAGDLERHFTEFQVVEDGEGRLIGAIGLQIEEAHGRIHSETYPDFALTDTLRPQLFERLKVVARNHGLFRFWTREVAPFWKKDAGFTSPNTETLPKLPITFGQPHGGWLTLQLREDGADSEALDKALLMFKEVERVKLEKIVRRGKTLKILGTLLSLLLFLFGLVLLFNMLRHR